MIVVITAEAERDLETIGDHIAQDNSARALTFVGQLREACLGLSDYPERFPIVARHEAHAICHRVVGNYLIFYRLDPTRVIILHVLHGAMDYAALLGEE